MITVVFSASMLSSNPVCSPSGRATGWFWQECTIYLGAKLLIIVKLGGGKALNKIKDLFLTCFQPPVWQIFTIVSTHSRLLAGVFCCRFCPGEALLVLCCHPKTKTLNVITLMRYQKSKTWQCNNVTMRIAIPLFSWPLWWQSSPRGNRQVSVFFRGLQMLNKAIVESDQPSCNYRLGLNRSV